MNYVIPMAGAGSRFVEAGYQLPKPLLKAKGKTLLEWSVDSLPLDLATGLIFIGLEIHRKFLEPLISERYGHMNLKMEWLDKVTRGQSETVLACSDHYDVVAPLVIFNIDTAFKSNTLRDKLINPASDGVIGCFDSNEDRFSYARIDKRCKVVEVREKKVISNNALTGLYHFTKCQDFISIAEDTIKKGQLEKGEFYIAPLYNKLINRGSCFVLDKANWVKVLGTPGEYEGFCSEV